MYIVHASKLDHNINESLGIKSNAEKLSICRHTGTLVALHINIPCTCL